MWGSDSAIPSHFIIFVPSLDKFVVDCGKAKGVAPNHTNPNRVYLILLDDLS